MRSGSRLRRTLALLVVAALAYPALPRTWHAGLGAAFASGECGTDTVLVLGLEEMEKTGASNVWNLFDFDFDATAVRGRRYIVEMVGDGITHATMEVNGVAYSGTSQGATVKQFVDVDSGYNSLGIGLKGSNGSHAWVRVMHVSEPQYKVFGEQTYTRLTPPAPETVSFALDTAVAGALYTLRVKSGNGNGTNRITNATVKINGTQVLSSSDFGTGVATVNKDVTLGPSNLIEVNNQGVSGSKMKVRLFATDRTAPTLAVTSPSTDTAYTTASSFAIQGTVTDAQTHAVVRVNGVGPYRPRSFSHTASLPSAAWYRDTVRAENSACLTTQAVRVIPRDTQSPTLTPGSTPTIINASSITLTGSWSDLKLVSLCEREPD